jgi:hypothetical protein
MTARQVLFCCFQLYYVYLNTLVVSVAPLVALVYLNTVTVIYLRRIMRQDEELAAVDRARAELAHANANEKEADIELGEQQTQG